MLITSIVALAQMISDSPFVEVTRFFAARGRENESTPVAITDTELIFRPAPAEFRIQGKQPGDNSTIRLNREGIATPDFLSWPGAVRYKLWNRTSKTWSDWNPSPNLGQVIAIADGTTLYVNNLHWFTLRSSGIQTVAMAPNMLSLNQIDLECIHWNGTELAVGTRTRELFMARGGRMEKIGSMMVPLSWTTRGLLAVRVKRTVDLYHEQLTTAHDGEAVWDGRNWIDHPSSSYRVTKFLGEYDGWEYGYAPSNWEFSAPGSVNREKSQLVRRPIAGLSSWRPVELPVRQGYALTDVVANFRFGEVWLMTRPFDDVSNVSLRPEVIRLRVKGS